MQRLAATFSEERSNLESQWDSGEDASTEDTHRAPALPLVLRPAPLGLTDRTGPGPGPGAPQTHVPDGGNIRAMAERDFMPLDGWDKR